MKLTAELKGHQVVELAARNFPHIALRALNRTAEQVKTQAGRIVRERYNLAKSEVDPGIRLHRATASSLVARVTGTGRAFTLHRFNAKQNARGVAVTIVKGQRKTIRGAFINRVKSSGREMVFKRVGRERMPIKVLRTISVAAMMRSAHVFGRAKAFFAAKLPEVMEREVKFYLFKNI